MSLKNIEKLGMSFVAAWLLCCFLAGCAGQFAGPPARDVRQLGRQGADREKYPRRTILLHNIQRVTDSSLPANDRVESAKVVEQLTNPSDSFTEGQFLAILDQKNCPPELGLALLEILLKRDHPKLTPHVIALLEVLEPNDPMRNTVLTWLENHPSPQVISEVARLWAYDSDVSSKSEARYKRVISRISGRSWDIALLEGINTPAFTARGSALMILRKRLPNDQLRKRIIAIPAVTATVLALQKFLEMFDYFPSNRQQLIAIAKVLRQPDLIGAFSSASVLAQKWQTDSQYKFMLRDFHLLASLAGDVLRRDTNINRSSLTAEVVATLTARKHIESSFDARTLKNLSIADLWTIKLLGEMFSDRVVQLQMAILSARDRRDVSSAWGGLITYRAGRAQGMYYPSAKGANIAKDIYTPSAKNLRDMPDSLCTFYCQFSKADNIAIAGGSSKLLKAIDASLANDSNTLVLTSITDETFAAHYHPAGKSAISLGIFRFGK